MNILETLKSEVSRETSISSISQKLGIDQEQTQTGLKTIIPVVLGALMKKSTQGRAFGGLSSILTGNTFPVDTDPEVELQNESKLLDRGKALISDLFGAQESNVNNALSQTTGLSSEKSSGLLLMSVPLITGFIGKMIAKNGWSIPDFIRNLFGEKKDIEQDMVPSLASSLGISDLQTPPIQDQPAQGNVSKTVPPPVKPTESTKEEVPPIEHTVPHTTLAPEPKSASGSVLKWIIIIAILALGAWYFLGQKGCNDNINSPLASDSLEAHGDTLLDNLTSDAKNIGTAVSGAVNDAGDWIYDVGNQTVVSLPNGEELQVGEKSVEKRLVDFIETDESEIDPNKWFPMDRLYFETGEATLKNESEEQLVNIAQILSAYPNVHIKLGGYTDNTGPAELNKQISSERANTAMQKIIDLGIDSNRLTAEGYGAEHPIAGNDTDAGRAQNRRIDIKVTRK